MRTDVLRNLLLHWSRASTGTSRPRASSASKIVIVSVRTSWRASPRSDRERARLCSDRTSWKTSRAGDTARRALGLAVRRRPRPALPVEGRSLRPGCAPVHVIPDSRRRRTPFTARRTFRSMATEPLPESPARGIGRRLTPGRPQPYKRVSTIAKRLRGRLRPERRPSRAAGGGRRCRAATSASGHADGLREVPSIRSCSRRAARRSGDKAGRPFVGRPAPPRRCDGGGGDRSPPRYVTNVVKHFKWEARGKRRITPSRLGGDDRVHAVARGELAVVKPRVLVCLGATAAQPCSVAVPGLRGGGVAGRVTTRAFVTATVHPRRSCARGTTDARRRRCGCSSKTCGRSQRC